MAASPLGATAHSGVFPSANNSLAAGILPTSWKTWWKYSRSVSCGCLRKKSSCVSSASLRRSPVPGQPALVDQVVVFHEAHEDAGQHPRHGDLIEIVLSPNLERLGGAPALFDLLEGVPQPGIDLVVLLGTGEQILVQCGDEVLEIREQRLDVHCKPRNTRKTRKKDRKME